MRRPFYKILYVQVLIAITLGVLLGEVAPAFAASLKPLGDGFIRLVRMIIPFVIFCTVVSGITGMQDAKRVGRVGAKAILYFEIVSTVALALGLVVANVTQPGAGFHADLSTLDSKVTAEYSARAGKQSMVEFVLNIIPNTVIDAFAKGDVLQVLLFALLFGFALSALGERGAAVRNLIDRMSDVVFGIIAIIMKAAPIGAFGAMAFTIGQYGLGALKPLAALMGAFYLTAIVFVIVVLGAIARIVGFSIFRFLAYIKEELLIVLGTSSSESALPTLMEKLERLAPNPWSGWLCPPVIPSISMARTSISAWRRCSSLRRPTRH